MAVRMRLARGGRKKLPFYSIVVADSRCARDGKFIEKIGYYNPKARGGEIPFFLNEEKAQEWFTKGAKATDGLARLLVTYEKGPQKLRDTFSQQRNRRIELKQKEADAKAAAEAAAQAKADAKAAAEDAAKAKAEAEAEAAAAAQAANADNAAPAAN